MWSKFVGADNVFKEEGIPALSDPEDCVNRDIVFKEMMGKGIFENNTCIIKEEFNKCKKSKGWRKSEFGFLFFHRYTFEGYS